MAKCSQCKRELDDKARIASISGSVMGDEYTDIYYFCDRCQVYTIAAWHDHFGGEDTVSYSGPIPKEKGDAKVELIKKCPDPWDKRCRCPAHQEYFKGSLD